MAFISNKTIQGDGDFRWLGSRHGIWDGRTETLDVSKFTKATHYPKGFIPSGTPVSLVDGVVAPYDGTTLAGHIFTDQVIAEGDTRALVPVLDHGRVVTKFVPGNFEAPATQPNTNIVYL